MSTTHHTDRVDTGSGSGQRPDDGLRIVEHRGATVLATGGLGLAAAGLIAVIAIDVAAAKFVAPPLAFATVGALLAWRFGRWSKAVAVLVGLMLLSIGGSQLIGNGLLRLDSFFDLVPGLMALSGASLGVIGGLFGLVGRESVPGRAVLKGSGGLIALVAVVSAVVSFAGDGELTAAERAEAVEVVMADGDYAVDELTVTAGEDVRFAVRNDDLLLHTFTVDALGIDVLVPPGQEILVTADAPAAGSFVFYCAPHSEATDAGRAGMAGSLTVEG